jgi:hypothetical protein
MRLLITGQLQGSRILKQVTRTADKTTLIIPK